MGGSYPDICIYGVYHERNKENLKKARLIAKSDSRNVPSTRKHNAPQGLGEITKLNIRSISNIKIFVGRGGWNRNWYADIKTL